MRLAVIGTGYVGLVSGVCLAAKGHEVVCVDINPSVVEQLNRGKPHIYEQGLEYLLGEVLAAGRFRATADLDAALAQSDGVMLAVGTPSENGVIDLDFVRAAARQIGAFLKAHDRFLPIIVKSTVVPGTTDGVVREELEAASGKRLGQFGLGMNPEFLREGNAITDFIEPDRIVLGYEDNETRNFLEALYAPWDCDKLYVNSRTAELIKYSNNALLAVQISAVNEIANLAARLGGIDILDVMNGVHLDKRWNPISGGRRSNPEILSYLVPGCGFGGSCFPKDVQALRSHGEQLGLPMQMLNAVLSVNESQPMEALRILRQDAGDLSGRRCLVLGLAFKPDTDDVRETASLRLISGLLDHGAAVTAHDPIATDNFKRLLGARCGEVAFCGDWRQQALLSDIIVVATKWSEYADLAQLGLRGKIIMDARRLLSPRDVHPNRYLSIGLRQ